MKINKEGLMENYIKPQFFVVTSALCASLLIIAMYLIGVAGGMEYELGFIYMCLWAPLLLFETIMHVILILSVVIWNIF
jgi:hypothetical protein